MEKLINIIYQIVSHITPKRGNRILLMSETRSMGGNLQALDERLKVRGLDKSFRISYCFSKTLERSKIRILLIWLKLAFMTGRQDFIFVDAISPVPGEIIRGMKNLKLICKCRLPGLC